MIQKEIVVEKVVCTVVIEVYILDTQFWQFHVEYCFSSSQYFDNFVSGLNQSRTSGMSILIVLTVI